MIFEIIIIGVGLLLFKLYPLIFTPPKKLKKPPQNTPAMIPEYKSGSTVWVDKMTSKKPIAFAKEGPGSAESKTGGWKPTTIPTVFERAVKLHGDKPALRAEYPVPPANGKKAPPSKAREEWKTWTYQTYHSEVRAAAKGLIALGVEPLDAVNIFGFNSPQWFMAEMAAIFCGGVAAGIYPSDTPEQVQYKSHHSGASVAVCEDMGKADRFKQKINELPKLKAIILWAEKPEAKEIERKEGGSVKLMTWDELCDIGRAEDNEELDKRIAELYPEQVCCLIYTSGTTGNPKAVMISHDNILFESYSVLMQCDMIGIEASEERIISYLPLSHVAGMMVDIICPMFLSAYEDLPGWQCVYFARPYDLKIATIVDRFKAVRPTMFLGVPRVWEKIAEKLQAIGKKTKGLVKSISTAAKSLSLEHAENCNLGGSGAAPAGYGLMKKLVLDKIKEKLGLDKMKFGFTGAAPIRKETLSYFGSLGIQVNEVYGMSECTGAITWSLDNTHVWGSCGYALPGCELKIFNPEDGKECPRAKDIFHPTEEEQGEICYRGRNIMLGYMSNPALGEAHVKEIMEKNAKAIDVDGWLHSGDKGCTSVDGMVKITGRYKELIIGAGGENVAPVPIESNVKLLCPAISNIMMFGDKKKFNIALVTLKLEGATGEKPGTDKLTGPAAEVKEGITTIDQAMNDKTIIDMITNAIKDTNKNGDCCPSNAAKIQRFSILPRDFSVETGELTPTLKLKRSVVAKMHMELIDRIYAAPRGDVYIHATKK
uniref:AMP-dependent synthetase/ligase domain-containing protein n=1 Tax=Lotharella globosa TaxID=91324 RepID=A0A6V3UG89_9EUKA|mmetsp:Transcript_14169/g.27859  ORF Transcript_14169/g.27859 Transcript_14169/m.27859 type:complete len:767 (-) Transcript_14169:250-2550(-)|eukprot:CAMPEP_0167794940 /NCGR_PEP_ID=MMETSP0111_2-20121227/14142_1 /TAXON_ID=91324 /ORGANISM="Lotharella globosa, Strain CCCM811" /LENGTH=766 /DNA_ID=CAMNT_0007688519 /DNA_START=21 /DNA_END=2321 /DNA_ORIENTATION=-